MALTLVIVSFSCTGPALGFILGNAASGAEGAWTFTYAMLGFGLGIAIPFGILAFFPVLLKKLPQSGAWLNSVKVIFGFIELAFAFKFLSNADLVNQWHFLHRESFIAIWIAITVTMAMYLFGKIQLPHDAPVQNISVFRFLLGLTTLSFAFYLLPGLWGAPLNVISGFPPPLKYAESKFGVGYTRKSQPKQHTLKELPQGAEYGPNNIILFEDYDTAMAYAKQVNKPLMIDFTGRACQNCRLMEENVWSKEQILPLLNNEVVLVSLFVDERTELPEDKQYISKYTGEKVTTVGEKWSELETFVYKNNSQPLYVIIDHNEQRMNQPVGYTPDVEEYYKWLRQGIDNFKKQQ
jgi:thiol:disulfide interchange protein DsbD